MKVLYEDDKLPTGKYEGRTIKEIAKSDPKYLTVFQQVGKNVCISDEVMEKIK